MRYVLFNDTSHTHNPGCQATVACLRALLAAKGMECVQSHPVGFGVERFIPPAIQPTTFERLQSRFSFGQPGKKSPPFDHESWAAAARQLERDYDGFFGDADAVVINAEGTLHHNQPSAAALVAWARAAKRQGLPVLTVNCTIEAMDRSLLDELFTASRYVAVREAWTLRDLRSQGYEPIAASDALFNLTLPANPPAAAATRRCIYSPGVLAASPALAESTIGRHVAQLIDDGWRVTFLTVESEDQRFESVASRAGAEIQPLRRWSAAVLPDLLRAHELVVSGRYHVMIFSWLTGRPVMPLPSNTWKMEGLLETAGLSSDAVQSMNAPLAAMAGVLPDADAMARLRALANENVQDF